MEHRNRGDGQAGEKPRIEGRCSVCGEPYLDHPIFGVCYRRAMSGAANQGRRGCDTIRR